MTGRACIYCGARCRGSDQVGGALVPACFNCLAFLRRGSPFASLAGRADWVSAGYARKFCNAVKRSASGAGRLRYEMAQVQIAARASVGLFDLVPPASLDGLMDQSSASYLWVIAMDKRARLALSLCGGAYLVQRSSPDGRRWRVRHTCKNRMELLAAVRPFGVRAAGETSLRSDRLHAAALRLSASAARQAPFFPLAPDLSARLAQKTGL